nr:protein trichome birefringence-like 38 [Ipomoea batatas]
MGERVWNSVFIVILFSLAFAYFCSKSLTPFYWIEEGSHENIHHLEMQATVCNGTGGGNSSRSIAKKMKSNSHCNWFQGTWVFDDSYPLYDSISCPFIRKVFHCIRFGRPDRQYLKYRWQPHGCELPKFDGRDFLSRMRGKKIMYIGDSLSLNNFESLLCLLHGTVPGVKYREEFTALNVTVTFLEYEVEVILYHSEFLVDIENRVAKMNSIKSGEIWKQMDVLILLIEALRFETHEDSVFLREVRLQQNETTTKERLTRLDLAACKSRSHSSSPSLDRSCKSLGELELEEVKGFMDLGFTLIFDKERTSKKMMSVLPGLQRLQLIKTKPDRVLKAWFIKSPNSPLLNLRMPRASAAGDIKRHLRHWAKTVATVVRQES